ncbi:unnamed protein product [Arctia plantaginis]|uniref:Uncharacterized protein n=1 Tax=Arctia plantaginis TaxID=874455 RepID=A0A8S0ZJZ0_ARCPL|nr:unnamed protein product [Arctia plantaginis]CAB3234181.1 unnamed protein product [Arctia plantaginis]
MAQSEIAVGQDLGSNDNSMSTKEFLQFEKTCEGYKDSDEEIKMIFSEINKLVASNKTEKVLNDDVDDVELILKRAEDISLETENLLKKSPISALFNASSEIKIKNGAIPQIKVTKPREEEKEVGECKESSYNKVFLILFSFLLTSS